MEKEQFPTGQSNRGVGPGCEAEKKTGELAFHKSEPRSDDQNEEKKICPMEQRPEAKPRFAEKNCETNYGARDHEKGRDAFCQKRESRGQPKTCEPETPKFLVLIAADDAVNRSANKKPADRVGCHHSPEQECTGRAEVNQARGEAAPITGEPFGDQKRERDCADGGERVR